jgi:adenine phosphoribosyltransferase
MTEALADRIAARLRDVLDFPEPGIVFKDITPLLADAEVFGAAVEALAKAAQALGPVDLVAGIEARGFILAAALAEHLGCGMVPVRKAGKLPPPTVRASYALEYGTAEIEVPVGLIEGRRVYVVDDVLATGGTASAALDLVTAAGGTVTGLGVLLELTFLAGRDRLGGTELTTLLRV